MKVSLKLYATLSDYLPVEARTTNRIDLEVEPGTTVQTLMERYRVPPKQCHVVLINGVFVPREERASRNLDEGAVLAIWPPIGGG